MSVHHHITLQNVTSAPDVPSIFEFNRWCHAALIDHNNPVEINIRIVDTDEMAQLNQTYRHKQGTTNVLAFAFDGMPDIDTPYLLLGDLVMCASVVETEAKIQHKPLIDHWAHLAVHSTLHLCGYDHKTTKQATEMESLEIAILAKLTIANPYQDRNNIQ